MWEEKQEGRNDESSSSKHNIKVTQVSIIKKNHSSYTPPINQMWEEKQDGRNDESSNSKHKIKVTQVSNIKENHSRYTPRTNQGWEEKEEGSTDKKESYSKHKKKRHKFQSSKKIIQGTHYPLIRCGRKNKRGEMIKAAIQNTK